MIETWTAGGDFAEVLDTLEEVKILRGGCHEHATETSGWRFHEERVATDNVLSALVQTEVTWQFAINDGEREPEPGDLVVDAIGGCSTLRSVTRQQGATRFVCLATRLKISPTWAERFDLVRPIWTETSEGPVLERVLQVRPVLVGYLKVSPSDPDASPVGVLYLVSPEPIQIGDHLRRHRGGEYEVKQIGLPKSIGHPWEIDVAEVAATA